MTWKQPLNKLSLWQFLLGQYQRFENEPDRLQKTVLTFAGEYGLLLLRSEDGQAEQLDHWQDLIDELLAIQKAFEDGEWGLTTQKIDIANIRGALVPDPLTRTPTLQFLPIYLEGAIRLQLAHQLARGAKIKSCRHCGMIFMCGIDGKRGDTSFCKIPCRDSYHNKRRARK